MDPLSIIASIIAILGATAKSYKAIAQISDLPNAFLKVKAELPLMERVLNAASNRLNETNLNDEERNAIGSIVADCERNAKCLRGLFEKLVERCEKHQDARTWSRFHHLYCDTLKSMKTPRAETLMQKMLEGIQKLALNDIFSSDLHAHLESITKAIKELSEVEPSSKENESDMGNMIHSHATASGTHAQQNNINGSTGFTMNSGNNFLGSVSFGALPPGI
jgi:hypothetical protein